MARVVVALSWPGWHLLVASSRSPHPHPHSQLHLHLHLREGAALEWAARPWEEGLKWLPLLSPALAPAALSLAWLALLP